MAKKKLAQDAERITLPLLEEQLTVSKREVTTGQVRVRTKVDTVEEIARADLYGDAVEVTRVAVERAVVGDPPLIRTEGDLTIVPIFEEILVVEKRLMLKEEVHIRRKATHEVVEMPVSLRRQRAEIERSTPESRLEGEVSDS